jgi:spore coat polysaccharide biosynthesis protein SpsF
MRMVAIIQARMGSTRLPGKVLMDIGGQTMLARVVSRVRRSTLIDEIVVATTINEKDDPIVTECRNLGVPYFRGSEEDVLDRYYQAALAHKAEGIVRITSDCPLIDPGEVDKVVREFLSQEPDYASNSLERTYPRIFIRIHDYSDSAQLRQTKTTVATVGQLIQVKICHSCVQFMPD